MPDTFIQSIVCTEKISCKECKTGYGKPLRLLNPGEVFWVATSRRRSGDLTTLTILCDKHAERREAKGSAKLVLRPEPVLPEPESCWVDPRKFNTEEARRAEVLPPWYTEDPEE